MVSRPVRKSRWPWGCATPTSAARSSAPLPGQGTRPPTTLAGQLPRTYLVAGTEEPFFRTNATRWADALREAGGDVVMAKRAGSHGDAFWKHEFR
jgi:acetyl esterase/lipase